MAAETYGLTEREVEVLGALAAGRTNREIADELFISVKTASVHVSNILRKLEVSGRQEAARVAHRLGVRGLGLTAFAPLGPSLRCIGRDLRCPPHVSGAAAFLACSHRHEAGTVDVREEETMSLQNAGVVAGMISTALFVGSYVPMLLRAARTRDLRSYSPANLLIANIGNVVHTVYIVSLPVGPIWVLHGFYLASTALMMWWWWRYRGRHPAEPEGEEPCEEPVAAQEPIASPTATVTA